MTEIASQLLATFDSLPAEEQHEVVVQILRRTVALPEAMLTDECLVSLADQLFQALDAEELDDDDSRSR